jgi:DNA (cytosine-5)-methyltransferase 1
MLTLTDMFCGAGGSSTGALAVPGIEVRTAMNHWARAIETHNANHQDTTHVCADISQTDPRYVARTDILWASPECTCHSVARGKKRVTAQATLFDGEAPDPAAERSRATMWDVPRFAEYHDYQLIITENVVDAARWVMFDAWLHAMDSLGYAHHIVYMNSMHAQLAGDPAPQSRDRMYVMFWKKNNRKPDFGRLRPKAYCPSCDEVVHAQQSFKRTRWGRYRSQYVWRCPKATCRGQIIEPGWLPASTAIDWTIKGQRIGDRAKPLAEKTMRRIQAGLDISGATSMQVQAAGNTYDSASGKGGNYYRIWPTTDTLRTQTGTTEQGLLVPVEGRDGKEARTTFDTVRTQTTRNETGLLVPYYSNGTATSSEEPLSTVTTVERHAFVTTLRNHNTTKDISQPLDTFAANGNHHGLVEYQTPAIDDCAFRMLEPHEIMAGMAFPKTYIMTGNKREQVKQSGNAVTPPAARDLITIATATLQPT